MKIATARILLVKINMDKTSVADSIKFLRLIAQELEDFEQHKKEFIVQEPSVQREWDVKGEVNAKAETFEFLVSNEDNVGERTQKKRAQSHLRNKLAWYFKHDVVVK